MSDDIGRRGEAKVVLLLTRADGRKEPLFRPQFLGEKYRTVDFLVELVGADADVIPYFFVQAKATTNGYTKKERRLKVGVSRADMRRLVAYPAPTYIIGIDDTTFLSGYLMAAVPSGPDRLSSLTTAYPLDDWATLRDLYDEVKAFWDAAGVSFTASKFV